MAYPPNYRGDRWLAVLRAYCDESYDSKGRVYAIAAYIAKDKAWRSVSRQWQNRSLKDGIGCFHAADCESGWGEFKSLSRDARIKLKTDLIRIVNENVVLGFGYYLFADEFSSLVGVNHKAQHLFGESPYFVLLQSLIANISRPFIDDNNKKPIAYIFDQQEQFSGRAKRVYDSIKKLNPSLAPHMGSIVYADKKLFQPLQIADNLAYEVMKSALNKKYDPERPERKSLSEMKSKLYAIGRVHAPSPEKVFPFRQGETNYYDILSLWGLDKHPPGWNIMTMASASVNSKKRRNR